MKPLKLKFTLMELIICAVSVCPFVSCSTTSEYGVTENTKQICLVKTNLPTQEILFLPTSFYVDSAANRLYCGNLHSPIPDFITLPNLTPKATEVILRAKKELEWCDAIQDARCIAKPTISDPTFKPEIMPGECYYFYEGKQLTDPYYTKTSCAINVIKNGYHSKECLYSN